MNLNKNVLNKKYFKIIFVIFFLFLQSCSFTPNIAIDCKTTDIQVANRYLLFKDLDNNEIQKRSSIEVTTYSKLDELSVFSKIVEAVKNASPNANFIPIDLRDYHSVNLGNIVISSIKSDFALNLFLVNSKYSQGFFALINFGKDKITIFNPTYGDQYFKKQEINRSDLQNVELIFNVKNSQKIFANMKFSENQKISLLARNIKEPFAVDLREASNTQYHMGKKWIMSVYDISQSEIKGGKKTSGYYLYVNNKDVKNIKLAKFNKSKVACYSNPAGFRFEENVHKGLKL